MKAIPQPRWVDETPAWEQREVDRHLTSDETHLRSEFIESPISLQKARERRSNGEPLEYILGHCHVADMTLGLNESVLIPRPETETLLRRFSDRLEALPDGALIDCGTGSGVLAVGIARSSDRFVVGTDVSRSALQLARDNARRNESRVQFLMADRLEPLRGPVAGIVANLPYVLRDSSRLEDSVRKYEPHEALFVPDDPETFYGEFLNRALDILRPAGELWMELDGELLEQVPFESLLGRAGSFEVREDEFGRSRFVVISTKA